MRFFLGMGLGYAIGLMLAPASGRETRRRVAASADQYGREKAREIGQRAGEKAYEEIKQQL